ncbi:hypothetical protein [Corynebacterium aquatimens]|uniref:Uncharacterized protein n=1 Tax=Corynebacterium aquatimens TaxID=1190508 RepID=A0A931DY07_9CORY|nr:hypothetical protein [Corynebacterium aquatimens]MBG6121054.1 hypothetical protein [Corynebacterium aquatimens]WJY66389.1 hypothetical protein CAQUA_08475 [Corynebacterium aquatimens]
MKVFPINDGNWMTPHSAGDTHLLQPTYYVFFWASDADWEDVHIREGFKLIGAKDVVEAISWEQQHANGRMAATLLPVSQKMDTGRHYRELYLVHGTYPQASERPSEPDFAWEMFTPDPEPESN